MTDSHFVDGCGNLTAIVTANQSFLTADTELEINCKCCREPHSIRLSWIHTKSQDPFSTRTAAASFASPCHPRPGSSPSSLIVCGGYREHDFEHWPQPSKLDLARLAAQLVRTEKLDPKQLVAEAWELYWESCRPILADHRKVEAFFAHEAELDRELNWPEPEAAAAVPMPKKFPVNHRQVEALLLPKQNGRTAERAALIREFIFSQLARTCLVVRPKLAAVSYWGLEADLLEQLRQKLKDEVARHFEKLRKTMYDTEAYHRFAVPFLEWRRRFIAAQKASAARARWAKQKAAPAAAAKAHAAYQKRNKKSLGEG